MENAAQKDPSGKVTVAKKPARLVDVAPNKPFDNPKPPGDGWGLMGMSRYVMVYVPLTLFFRM
jgi:hypothetical protein